MGAGSSAINPLSLSGVTERLPALLGGSAFHCAMIGLDSAGKTTVLYRLKFNQYVNTAPTIGFNCEKVRLNGCSFVVWDVGGQDKLRPLWRSYTRCTDGIIFVIDSCKEDRLEEAKLELLRFCKIGVPLLVLANKQDLPAAVDPDQLEQRLGLNELDTSCFVQSTCAVTGEGLEEGMQVLQQMILRRRRVRASKARADLKELTKGVVPRRKLQRSHSHIY